MLCSCVSTKIFDQNETIMHRNYSLAHSFYTVGKTRRLFLIFFNSNQIHLSKLYKSWVDLLIQDFIQDSADPGRLRFGRQNTYVTITFFRTVINSPDAGFFTSTASYVRVLSNIILFCTAVGVSRNILNSHWKLLPFLYSFDLVWFSVHLFVIVLRMKWRKRRNL